MRVLRTSSEPPRLGDLAQCRRTPRRSVVVISPMLRNVLRTNLRLSRFAQQTSEWRVMRLYSLMVRLALAASIFDWFAFAHDARPVSGGINVKFWNAFVAIWIELDLWIHFDVSRHCAD